MALTEPDAGSNTLELRSFARADGDGWRLSGQKIWITGVKEGHKMLVVARTKKIEEVSRRTEGLTMFMIDIDRPGLSYAPIEKLGTNTLSSCSVFFDDVRIEPHELVGTLHGGWFELLEVLNTERIVTTAALIGAGDMAIRQAVEYAKVRKVFNKTPIGAYQGVQFPLAQAHAQLQTARLMNLKAAWLCDQGRPYGSEANTAKLIAAQAAMSAIEHAMQTLGGMGYARESHLERLWRDARLFKFAPVAEEMVLNFIATHDLGLPRGY
jgi:acyl-CoA dehydrogenase